MSGMWGAVARLRGDGRGNVSILMAGALIMLSAVSALGIDTASLFLEKRRLQGIADAAAVAAAGDLAAGVLAAERIAARFPGGEARVARVENGRYDADLALAVDRRFSTGVAEPNAARVRVEGGVTTIFGRVLGLQPRVPIAATATAARVDSASFSIGSRLAALEGGLANAVLSGLAGADLQLSTMDYSALASSEVDLLRWLTALRLRSGLDVATFGDLLAANTSLPVAINALADVVDAPAAAVLRELARRVPARTVRLGDIIDLGPLAMLPPTEDAARPVRVGTLALLREAILIGGKARTVRAALTPALPGLATTRLRLEIGERPAQSPWLAIGRASTVTVRTAQARLWVDATLLAAAPLGLGTIHIPIVSELAQAEARLSALNCSAATGRAATLDVLPSLGQAAIAEVEETTFGTFTTPLSLRPVRIVDASLASVSLWSVVQLGGSTVQQVRFDEGEVTARTVKTVSTTGIVGGVAASLIREADLRVTVLGLGLSGSGIASALGSTLAAAAPSLDALLEAVTATAGLRVGQADVWVNGLRCGAPVLVG